MLLEGGLVEVLSMGILGCHLSPFSLSPPSYHQLLQWVASSQAQKQQNLLMTDRNLQIQVPKLTRGTFPLVKLIMSTILLR